MRVLVVFGTRPEAIKLAPVIGALGRAAHLSATVCVTGQHREMLDQVLRLFAIEPDYDLGLMRPGQAQAALAAGVLTGLDRVIEAEAPDVIMVQGDTTSCLAAALAGFYRAVPVAHVEAGLRTGDLTAPFPEEGNRCLVSSIASYHFAPTEGSKQNLLKENIGADRIWVTGNTVIDALLSIRDRLGDFPDSRWREAVGAECHDLIAGGNRPMVLITGHRRENFGAPFRELCQAIRQLAERHPDWLLVYPVHLNPNVRQPVGDILSGLANVALIEPLDYLEFVWLMDRARLILTDSGGIQEEAPSLGKPVLVMREVTERPEAVAAGTVRLVGTDGEKIVAMAEQLMTDSDLYERMARAHNPYGDGTAAARIVDVLETGARQSAATPGGRAAASGA